METIKKRQAEIFFIVFGIIIIALGTAPVSTRDQLVEAKGDIRDKNIVRTGTSKNRKTTLEFYIGEHKYVVTYLARDVSAAVKDGERVRVLWNSESSGGIRKVMEVWVGTEPIFEFDEYRLRHEMMGRIPSSGSCGYRCRPPHAACS